MQHNYKYIHKVYHSPGFDRSIVDNRYLIYQFDTMGFTMLHWAAKKNDVAMAKMLLEKTSS